MSEETLSSSPPSFPIPTTTKVLGLPVARAARHAVSLLHPWLQPGEREAQSLFGQGGDAAHHLPQVGQAVEVPGDDLQQRGLPHVAQPPVQLFLGGDAFGLQPGPNLASAAGRG